MLEPVLCRDVAVLLFVLAVGCNAGDAPGSSDDSNAGASGQGNGSTAGTAPLGAIPMPSATAGAQGVVAGTAAGAAGTTAAGAMSTAGRGGRSGAGNGAQAGAGGAVAVDAGAAPATGSECVVAKRLDRCCPQWEAIARSALAADECLVEFPGTGVSRPLAQRCFEKSPDPCELVDCAPISEPLSRIAIRIPPGDCRFSDECSKHEDCALAEDVNQCCACAASMPVALLEDNACLRPVGAMIPDECPGCTAPVQCGACAPPPAMAVCQIRDSFSVCR